MRVEQAGDYRDTDVADVAREIAAGIAGRTSTSRKDRHRYRSNFGNFHSRRPAIVAEVRDPDDVTHILRVARRASMPVTVRGRGHSFGYQGLSPGGILLVNRVARPPEMVSDTTVEVPAGLTWREVERALNRVGRSFPVLTNEPDVSVGGTLAVGGYGEASLAAGGQVAHVRRATLVTAKSRRLHCSPAEQAELFPCALASLGQIGILESVRLETRPIAAGALVETVVRPTLAELVADLCRRCEAGHALDFLSGQHFEGRYVAMYGVHLRRLRRLRWAHRRRRSPERRVVADWHGRVLREQRRTTWRPDRVFAWGDYVVDAAQAPGFARHVERAAVGHPSYAAFGGRVLVLAVAGASRRRFALEPLPRVCTGPAIGFGVYVQAPTRDESSVRRVRALHHRLLSSCLEAGGRPYLSGSALPTASEMPSVFGSDYDRLVRLRARFDPDDLINRDVLGDPS